MIRLVAIQVALFLLPFVAYAAWVAARRRGLTAAVFRAEAPMLWLAVGGLVLMIVSLIGLSAFDGGSATGTYVPDRFDHGRLIPGHIE